MKHLICTQLIMVVASLCFSQPENNQTIDSIFRNTQKRSLNYPDSAYQLSLQIQKLSQEQDYPWGLVQSKLIQGIVLFEYNNLDSAAKTLVEILSESKSMKGQSFEEGLARYYLGITYRRLNNFDKALKYFIESENIFETLNEYCQYKNALNSRGTLYGMRGEFSDALEIFIKLRDLSTSDVLSKEDASKTLSTALGNIAVVYSALGNRNQALVYAMQGLAIDRENDDLMAIANSYNVIGTIFYENNQLDSALAYFKLCSEIPMEFPGLVPAIRLAQQHIAKIYADQGKLDLAISLLFSSLESRDTNEHFRTDVVFTEIGSYFLQQKRYDSALYYSARSLSLAEKNRRKEVARNASRQMEEAFLTLKQFDSAYYYQSLFHLYNDSIFSEASTLKYNNLRIQLATAEKEKEIEVLEKQGELDEANRALLVVSIIAVVLLSIALTVYLFFKHRNRQIRLKSEVEKRELELQQQTLHMINLNNSMAEVEVGLKSLKKKDTVVRRDVQALLSNIFVNRSMDKEWEQLETYFSKIHPKFNSQLLKRHENLTQKERRLLALIKLDLNTREISGILSIEQRSVVMSRYRLKQKLGLAEKEDLDAYVQTF